MNTTTNNRHRRAQSPHQKNNNNDAAKTSIALSTPRKVKLYQKSKTIMRPGELDESTNVRTLKKSLVKHIYQEDEQEHFSDDIGTNEKVVNNDDQALALQNICSPQEKIPEDSNPTKLNYAKTNETFIYNDAVDRTESNRSCSSHNSGEKMTLRETLQQLPSPRMLHRNRKVFSPVSKRRQNANTDTSLHHGILNFVSDDIKKISGKFLEINATSSNISRKRQSSSDPTASPVQYLTRSHTSLEKSPRRKRSKSDSKRRRDRKLIAAGEMEVRQANESLMHCMNNVLDNDTSLSGELEIDHNIEERRMPPKTNSQRIKNGHISNVYSSGGLSSILKELSDNYLQIENKEIYNPFTPVTSPTDNAPGHVDKMFMQTSCGYRPIEHSCYCKHCLRKVSGFGRTKRNLNKHCGKDFIQKSDLHGCASSISGSGILKERDENLKHEDVIANFDLYSSHDTCDLLPDDVCHRYKITSNIVLACLTQKTWLLVSNICHGLLAGLGLAQLIFVLSGNYTHWSQLINLIREIFDAADQPQLQTSKVQRQEQSASGISKINMSLYIDKDVTSSLEYQADAIIFINIYMNTFYCLAVICMISVLDRMDICRWSFRDSSELVSFRWLITFMIHVGIIVFTIFSYALDEKLYFMNNLNINAISKMLVMENLFSWSSLCLSRCISAICGWCIIGITQHKGFLWDYLISLMSYHVMDN